MLRNSHFLIVLPIFLLFSCSVVNLPELFGPQLQTGEVVLNSNIPGQLPPPPEIQVQFQNRHPLISWEPNLQASYYQVFRKAQNEKEFSLILGGERVDGLSIMDTSITQSLQFGLYEYRVRSVGTNLAPGYLSNSVVCLLESEELEVPIISLVASEGCFDAVSDAEGSLVIGQNKKGILLTIQMDPKGAEKIAIEKFNLLLLRREVGSDSWELIESTLPCRHTTEYYVDVPPKQGAGYDYGVVLEKSKDGAISKAVYTQKPGFVYEIPTLLGANPFPNGAAGKVQLQISDNPLLVGAEVWIATSTQTPAVAYDNGAVLPLSWQAECSGKAYLTLDSQKIFNALGTPDVHEAEAFLFVKGVYRHQQGYYSTVYSNLLTTFVYKEGAVAELPVVKATNGRLGATVSPITLSWERSANAAIIEYRIYRANDLQWNSAKEDQTVWTQVATVAVPSEGSTPLQWEDATPTSAGGFVYKVNPVLSGNIESENNKTLDSFSYAVMELESAPRVTSVLRASLDHIDFSWSEGLPLTYQIEMRHGNEAWPEKAKELAYNGAKYSFKTDLPGYWSLRIRPYHLFTNNEKPLRKLFLSDYSSETRGAIDLTDEQWILYCYQAILEGQKRITPNERQSNLGNGGTYLKKGNIEFKRRALSGQIKDDRYDGYHFKNWNFDNGSLSLSGTLYYLYFVARQGLASANYLKPQIYLAFTSSNFTSEHNKNDDKVAKHQGSLIIGGLYPGELQIWAKQNGFDHRNDANGPQIIGDYPLDQFYAKGNLSKIDWFFDNFGFALREADSPAIENKNLAFSYRRDLKEGASIDWKSLSWTQGGNQ